MPSVRSAAHAPQQGASSQENLALRRAFARFATGVTAMLRAHKNGAVCGLTINSFASLSLSPPLILWALARDSALFDLFAQDGPFSVNVLHRGQRRLAERLARPHCHELAAAQWQRGKGGAPVLTDALARFECRAQKLVAGGDHVIVVGAVEHFDVARRPPRDALLFLGGGYDALWARSKRAASRA